MWTINLCQLDLHWTLSHMFKQQLEHGNFEGIYIKIISKAKALNIV